LEESDHDTDVGSTPAAFSEAIGPRSHLQEECVLGSATLQIRVLLRVHLLVEAHFGLNVHVLLTHTSIGGGEVAQLA
jgi:hypothetical protein